MALLRCDIAVAFASPESSSDLHHLHSRVSFSPSRRTISHPRSMRLDAKASGKMGSPDGDCDAQREVEKSANCCWKFVLHKDIGRNVIALVNASGLAGKPICLSISTRTARRMFCLFAFLPTAARAPWFSVVSFGCAVRLLQTSVQLARGRGNAGAIREVCCSAGLRRLATGSGFVLQVPLSTLVFLTRGQMHLLHLPSSWAQWKVAEDG
jgi:hypothetical protein